MIAREGLYGYDWFSNMELNKPNIKGLLDNGFISIFPNRDQFGRLTVMLKLSVVDPSIPTIGCEALTTLMMAAETVFDDEENQIRGFNYILDVSNVTLRHYFIFPFPVWFKYCKNIEVRFDYPGKFIDNQIVILIDRNTLRHVTRTSASSTYTQL